jgi:hypothetical protein
MRNVVLSGSYHDNTVIPIRFAMSSFANIPHDHVALRHIFIFRCRTPHIQF